jgi:hypothetical protein
MRPRLDCREIRCAALNRVGAQGGRRIYVPMLLEPTLELVFEDAERATATTQLQGGNLAAAIFLLTLCS